MIYEGGWEVFMVGHVRVTSGDRWEDVSLTRWTRVVSHTSASQPATMSEPYYPRPGGGGPPDFDRGGGGSGSGGYGAKMYRGGGVVDEGVVLPFGGLNEVITEQPLHHNQGGFGSQVSTGQPFGGGGGSRGGGIPTMMSPGGVGGVPLPGFELLDRIPAFKIHTTDLTEGYTTCSPGYKIYNAGGEQVLRGGSDTLFCPFDSKQKSVYVKDANEDVIFQVKFTPSICECDSEEKRCFAVFSPVFENPFGAILFEAGQLKYSLKILNALEAETFAVQYIGSSDITIKGADGSVVAIINITRERWSRPKYSLTLMEEVSTANKALFISCAITLDLVSCEHVCTRCICSAPIVLGCLGILGLFLSSVTHSKGGPTV